MAREKRILAWIAALLALLALTWLSWPRHGAPPRESTVPVAPEYPPELAEAIRDSVQMVSKACEDASAYALWSGRWRLLAIAIGVSTPLVVAYLIFRSAARKDPDETEVAARLLERGRELFLPKTDPHQLDEPSRPGAAEPDPPEAIPSEGAEDA